METPSPRESNLRRPHPLAAQLVERLRSNTSARILDFGSGSGRNSAALRAARFDVCAVADDSVREFRARENFDAAVSTHALLHGTPQSITAMLQRIASALKPDAPLYATFGSKTDASYGQGTRIGDDTYAPDSGDEQGVAHVYFDEQTLSTLLGRWFILESIEEHAVDDIVGTWAHAQRPEGSVHWFVRARRYRK
jgi:methyltransferase family protein